MTNVLIADRARRAAPARTGESRLRSCVGYEWDIDAAPAPVYISIGLWSELPAAALRGELRLGSRDAWTQM